MVKVDVLIIGGSAAGLVAALTAKGEHPSKRVMMIRKESKVMIPCGIPYIFGSLENSDQNILPDAGLVNLGVEIIMDEVISIDTHLQTVKTARSMDVTYDRLILATGSLPNKPAWLKGKDLENVFVIPKNKDYLDHFSSLLSQFEHIIVVGGGFIGVEVSDELNKIGKKVTLIEKEPHILGLAFDEEIALDAEQLLISRGVKVINGVGLQSIQGDKKVEGVELCDGRMIEADAVILSMGYVPNNELAKASEIPLNEKGFIVVDEYMRTPIMNVFAAGDCAEKRDFSTKKISTTMLASTACAEARVAAMNLFHLSTIRRFSGTIGIYATNLGDTSYGVAGLTESVALKEGFDIICGKFQGIDRHPGKLSNAHKQMVKLVVAKESGRILGGLVIGGLSTGELTNVIGIAIQTGMTIYDLLTAQIGTHPRITASPAAYPLIKAAESIYHII
jgi:pyruvate/2-oxoglutarate dehydrogenase complex dihydrolipoamide dehydrogenase (E3) component